MKLSMLLLGAGLFFAYQWTGALVVRWLRTDLWSETWGALLNVLTWPAGLVMQLVVWPIYRRRRERARQARIAAKVASGERRVRGRARPQSRMARMSAAPIGSNVSLYYDAGRIVCVGDFIRTRSGRTYLVTAARQQQRGAHVGRWHLRCDVVPTDTPQPDDVVHPLAWYPR